MPQITLSVPQNKLPMLHDLLMALGIESNKTKNSIVFTTRHSKLNSPKNLTGSVFKKYFTWEYFSNELEFE